MLVATDLAIRGMHVDGAAHVAQVDATENHIDDLHRAGKTTGASAYGTIVILATDKQKRRATLNCNIES